MTKEDKELLFKDICARVPYGVLLAYSTKDNPNTLDKIGKVIYVDVRFGIIQMQDVSGISYGLPPSEFNKPYLRPMSSMTEEEINEFILISDTVLWLGDKRPTCILSLEQMDWLNAHHFDYRGLIGKGLAIEVTEENNPYEN